MNTNTEMKFSDNAIDLHIAVEKWLVRGYGEYSVAQMADGHLLLAEGVRGRWEVYEYEDFEDFAEGDTIGGSSNEPPCSVVRAVARVLGITHIIKSGMGYEVDSYYRSDEFDELRNVEYQPK